MNTQTSEPNILIIHADQHRFDCVGAYGNSDIRTPNIDNLARDGTRFDNSFCSFPVCTPSRYSLLTGQYVHQHLGWSNHCTLPAGIPTVPRVLGDAGYRTKAVGKMHFTPTYLDVGYDEMILAEQDGPGRFDDDYHRWLRDQGLIDRIDITDQRREYRDLAPKKYWQTIGAGPSDLDEAHHSTTWIADRAVEALDGWTDGGSFLMVGFIKPHHPFDPPVPWNSMYDPDALSLLPGWLDKPLERDLARHSGYFPHAGLTEVQVRRAMAHYYASISQLDFHVGRMVDHLKRRGLYESTMIIYTSDHGDYMGFHHLMLKANHMYDPVVKVPLVIKFPGAIRPGQVSDELVSNVDLAPTILRTAGARVPVVMGGYDLRVGAPEREVVCAESVVAGQHGVEYMARTKSHKLLLMAEDGSQFYDLRTDPLEMVNRIDDPVCRQEVAEMRNALMQWALFEAPSKAHLDLRAPQLHGDNVPGDLAKSSAAVEDYFKRRMTE